VSKELTPSIISLLLLNLAGVGANSVTRLFLSTILGEVCTACVAFLFSFYSLHCPCAFLSFSALPLCFAGFVLAASNGVAGMLSDYTAAAGYGNVGCFVGGASACAVAGILLIFLTKFGDLGRQDLIVGKAKRA
jgi:hypothetical protein